MKELPIKPKNTQIQRDKQLQQLTVLKARLAVMIVSSITKNKLTQKAAAELLGTSQPRLSNLINGHLDRFSIDMLLSFLVILGFDLKLGATRTPSLSIKVTSD